LSERESLPLHFPAKTIARLSSSKLSEDSTAL